MPRSLHPTRPSRIRAGAMLAGALFGALLSFTAAAQLPDDEADAGPLANVAFAGADALQLTPAADETMLATQRGRAPGASMLVALSASMRPDAGPAVTLWDEIVPPARPMPAPVEAPRALQGNRLSLLRQ